MKNIFALLITLASFATAFSQSRKIDDARRVINGGDTRTSDDRKVYGDHDTRYPSGTNDEDAINREYDRKVRAVRNNPLLSSAEKERRIRDLRYERDQRIREKNGYGRNNNNRRYNDRDRDYDDDRNEGKNKKYKQNNGKRKGWTKGRGNPHRNGNWKN